MKSLHSLLIAAAALAVAVPSASAETLPEMLKREMEVTDASLAECRKIDGVQVEPLRCSGWKGTLARAYAEEAQKAENARYTRQAILDDEAYQKDLQKKKDAELAERAARRAQRDQAEREHLAVLEKQRAAQEAAEAAADRHAAKLEADRKAKCNDDYKKPRVGMTIERVKECVSTAFKVAGQTNTGQGVVTTYRAPGGYLNVIDGKVVQWGYLPQ